MREAITDALKGMHIGEVETDDVTLDTHSRDASIFAIRPNVVVYPDSVESLSRIVSYVASEKKKGEEIALSARAAGTCMSGGSLTPYIMLDFMRHFNHTLEIGSDYAITQPGVFYRDFEKETLAHGLIMPSYPASRELCAIGGIVNNNSGGERTLLYGKTEKYVEEVSVVLSNGDLATFGSLTEKELEEKKTLTTFEGDIYRKLSTLIGDNSDHIKASKPKVSKNSAGYYLWNVYDETKKTFNIAKLIAGAQGTLALVTKVKLLLVKPKVHRKMLVVFLHDLASLPGLVNAVLPLKPESVESYDDHTFSIAIKFFGDIAKRMKGNMIMLGLQFIPEFWMALTGGIPKLIVMAEFAEDTEEEANRKLSDALTKMRELGLKARGVRTEREAKKYWTFRRESFNLLRSRMKGLRTAPFIDDLVVLPKDLPEFMPRLEAVLKEYNLIYTVAGHVGDGNFHIIPLMDLSDQKSVEIIEELSGKVYALLSEFKGSITGEHNDGLIRTPFLHTMFDKRMLDLFKETKDIFDPEGIFNPGKKVGGSLDYSWQHIDRRHA